MPKEPTNPLFCCGELHQSRNYHKRTVHQQHTKIYFKDHPDASFLLRRNPQTQLFHCPRCDRSWAMATPVRNHIFQKCEGYVQYRSPLPKIKIKPIERDQQDDADIPEEAIVKEEHSEFDKPTSIRSPHREATDLETSVEGILTTSGFGTWQDLATTPGPMSPTASDGSDAVFEEPAFLLPILRPAIWTSVNTCTGNGTASRPLSSVPSLTQSVSSRSSTLSLQTAYDGISSGIRMPKLEMNAELDHVLGSTSAAVSRKVDAPPSAARVFLDGLRRPLGHAAPHLHALGLITEADLDLVCTMSEAWDEVGNALRANGVTMIEWFLVKEGFKARAKQVSWKLECIVVNHPVTTCFVPERSQETNVQLSPASKCGVPCRGKSLYIPSGLEERSVSI